MNAMVRRKLSAGWRPRRSGGGFSLIEILVVVGIIILLIGIALPAINYARRQARRAATVATIGTISTALDKYYDDFKMYPSPISGDGSQGLAWALAGWQDGNADGAGPQKGDSSMFGFRTNSKGFGPVYGPYVQINDNIWNGSSHVFIDGFGYTIQYFLPDTTAGRSAFAGTNGVFPSLNIGSLNSDTQQFLRLLGDQNMNNVIDPGETVMNSTTYLLVSQGLGKTMYTKDSVINGVK